MICPKCKAQNEDTATACASCGAPLPKKKKMGTGAKIAIAVGSLGVVGIAIMAFLVVAVLVVVLIFAIPAFMKTKKVEKPSVDVQVEQVQDAVEELPEQEPEQEELPPVEEELPPVEEETSPVVQSPYRLMNVTSNLGLNVREQPNTASPVVAVLIQNRHVFVERIENNWAYVVCGEVRGWCSTDYLEAVPFQGTTVYRQAEIDEARFAAEQIIDTYYGKNTMGGRTDISVENVVAYFESCSDLYACNAAFGSQFEKLIPVAADEYFAYYFVEDSKIKTVYDLCDKYFSCYSDELAAACLKGRVLLLDGRLAIGFSNECYRGYYVGHTYEIEQISPSEINVHVIAQEYDSSLRRDSAGKALPDSVIQTYYYTFPCVVEDGKWVFSNMQAVFDR